MRVIAGTHRSRLLVSPPGTLTRPTSDRLRETLFNILAPRIPGSNFLDLYAGTGAVGIEALSRGAARAWFAESATPALKSLRTNLAALKLSSYTLEDRGVTQLLQKLSVPMDIIFLDPPYEAEDEYSNTLGYLGSAAGRRLFKPDTLVIAEHATKPTFKFKPRYGTLHPTRTLKQGDASITFYTTPQPPE